MSFLTSLGIRVTSGLEPPPLKREKARMLWGFKEAEVSWRMRTVVAGAMIWQGRASEASEDVERKRALLVLVRVRSFEGTEEWATVVRRGVAKVIFVGSAVWEQKGCVNGEGNEREEKERMKEGSFLV